MYRSTLFLTSALVGGEWSTSCPSRFNPGERAPIWVGPRIGLDDVERTILPLAGLELRLPRPRLTRSQWLYRLSYPGFSVVWAVWFLLKVMFSLLSLFWKVNVMWHDSWKWSQKRRTITHATAEELLGTVFSMPSMPYQRKIGDAVVWNKKFNIHDVSAVDCSFVLTWHFLPISVLHTSVRCS
jgi:hypothetical protein